MSENLTILTAAKQLRFSQHSSAKQVMADFFLQNWVCFRRLAVRNAHFTRENVDTSGGSVAVTGLPIRESKRLVAPSGEFSWL